MLLGLLACGDGGGGSADAARPADAGIDGSSGECVKAPNTPKAPTCSASTSSNIQHLVVLIQENHSFDNYFGKYCTATTGSKPTCTTGPSCCEAAPAMEASGQTPALLDDMQNGIHDPNHQYDCNLDEIHGGLMDRFVVGMEACATAFNFAVAATDGPVAPYIAYAQQGAIADRYFQPVVGQSSSNDMYFARAAFVFKDNDVKTNSIGSTCPAGGNHQDFTDTTVGDLLETCNVTWKWYAEGYAKMKAAVAGGGCPTREAGCPVGVNSYPCMYDPTDVPFQYYPALQDDPAHFVDLAAFATDVQNGTLPAISYVKVIGFKTEHPGFFIPISGGVAAAKAVIDPVLASSTYKDNTLVLVTYDEGGGYYDHVSPPPTSTIDCQPYGVRTILIALGKFARPNHISHVTMEHSSLVRFIEWNWFSAQTGHLGQRDSTVNNIGDLLDAAKTGTAVPAD